ncbi:DUF3450 domain-containing protein [Vibrio hepatarius]|jgi:predicted RNase H-like nuclease (RuvC/YqgF family)|uniref:Energy transducer TonB n=1 Tax=Vibrio hepatarius TaxID=171383 RepID=A0A0M0I2N8_9VIBR|nr:DUF3450 domain-containing protein [Vibrio hepatarius]KOO08362.1 energy transducer TonB [Vibrio hepatarius]
MNFLKTSAVICSLVLSASVPASGIEQALSVQKATNNAAIESQERIDQSDERIQRLKAEIKQLEAEVENLEVYQKHLTKLVANQEQETQSLNQQLSDIQQTRQDLVPLMYKMLDGLKQTLANDIPLQHSQRQQRIEKLEQLMVRADVSDAEKYRMILDAYQVEVEYGSKLGVYRDTISAGGFTREAELLHLGRVVLLARSIDESLYWSWDKNHASWQDVPSSSFHDIAKAFDVAKQRLSPEMLTLPVSIVEVK